MKFLFLMLVSSLMVACASEPKYLVRDDLGQLREVQKVSESEAVIFQDNQIIQDQDQDQDQEQELEEVYEEEIQQPRCQEQKKLVRKFRNNKGDMVYEYEYLSPLCVE